MKNILLISSSAAISGAEIVTKDFVQNSKHRYYLCAPDTPEVKKFYSEFGFIDTFYSPYYMKKGNSKFKSRIDNLNVIVKEAFFLNKIIKKIGQNNIDLIYCNNTISCLGITLLGKIRKIDIPVVLHIHDMMTSCSFTPLVKRLCIGYPTITVSQACKDELIKYAGLDKNDVNVIYNGIDVKKFFPSSRDRNDATKNIVIGYAGNIIERKGVVFLAKAFSKLNQDNPNTKLRISYHLSEKNYLNDIKGILEGKNVEYCNYPREKMREFYDSIDILVVPSLKDPLPTTVLEAMGCGKIVIGSNVDGNIEMLENKYLFERGSSEDLYRKLKEIIDKYFDEVELCKKQNPIKISKYFSFDAKNEKMDKFFNNVGLRKTIDI
ncbi:hypothetical protein AC622_00990 [Bacillus sp. FJAT-27916]|uniref:glycosyltransferase family 4 protein n=1 Tax=Bacillus sp. FJAT-27916 TaxID=1679169 RepID=UPI0006708DD5|nr:glycosyltransferase family 4 protein [Bacillus sp. FJAT-27916]KMY43011.1 hypothetical protein AC622_00990 [Bacillus sp. FJAT-27916]